jgi:hypothetical protein
MPDCLRPVPRRRRISGISLLAARRGTLGQAAGDDRRFAVALVLRHLEDGVDRSCFALSMKAQVLTTMTSASFASAVISCPACWASQHHLAVDEFWGTE